MWAFGAWELGRSGPLSSQRRARVTSRAPPVAMALPTGTPCFPPDIWLLARSSSIPTAAIGLGLSLHWEEPGADEDLDLVVCCWKARLGMTWLMALARFWASTKCSVMDSTASLKRPEGVTGVFSSTLWSASLRSARFSQRYLWRTIIKPMALPTAWAACFVAISAKSVAARRSFTGLPSAACRSFAWKTCSTAMACSADTASPWLHAIRGKRFIREVGMVLPGFEGRLMSEPRVLAAAGHRCAATVSLTGGERT